MGIFGKIKGLVEVKYTRIFSFYLGFISFVFCVFPKWVPMTLLGLLICVIVGYVKKKIVFQINIPAILLFTFYIAYLIGVLFTDHMDKATNYLEFKLSFVVFPLLLSFRFKEKVTLRNSSVGLILGVFVASVLGLFHSYWLYREVGDFNNSFGSVRFSYIHHPSYFSVFLTMAMSAAWYGYFQKWKGFKLIWVIVFSLFTLAMQLFCFSLAGMLFLFLLGLTVYIVISYKYFSKLLFIISTVLIPVAPIALYNSNIHIQIEVDDAFSVVKEFTGNPVHFIKNKKDTVSGSEVRVIMWIVAYQEFKKNIWGVGTGNVDDHLSARLIQYDQKELAKHEYNPHNQFLQTGLEIGIIGLSILILLIFYVAYYAWKTKNWILLILIASLFFNCFFESMLQRQSGIVFYSFWICLLMLIPANSNSTEKIVA